MGKTQQNSQLLLSCFLPLRAPGWMLRFNNRVPECPDCPGLSSLSLAQDLQFFCLIILLFHPLEETNLINSDSNLENTVTSPRSETSNSSQNTTVTVFWQNSTRGCVLFIYGKNSHWREKSRFGLIFSLCSNWYCALQKAIEPLSYR